jgi:hypothetical protein
MRGDQFRQLLKVVQGKDVYDIRADEVKEILEELWVGEFRDIKETKISVNLEEREDRSLASVTVKNGKIVLWINPQNWKDNANFAKGEAFEPYSDTNFSALL